jgi:HEPN domain-containing protein
VNLSRSALQALSWERLREARCLAGAGLWPGAYYLTGHAVECALKACIVKKQRKQEVAFDKGAATRIYTHDLVVLLKLADVPEPDPATEASWTVAKDWTPDCRYRLDIPEALARDYIKAVGGRKGVLAWLRRSW